MKLILKIVVIAFMTISTCLTQTMEYYTAIDTVINNGGSGDSPTKITSLDLTGSIQVMALVIGFSDRPHSWPTISNDPAYPNEHWPHLGAFPSGITLRDYIAQNGPIPVEDWYGVGFEQYIEKYSGGKYTADAIFPKESNGEPYQTIHNFQYWIDHNGGSSINVVLNHDVAIVQEALYNLLQDDPDALDGVDMIQASFVGITVDEFYQGHAG